jgi:ABC-type oligopeptide transport system substrate-binding subunit
VARSWDISSDGRTYTFHLRNDARWSDGKPLTSNDFLYSWQRMLSMDLAAKNAFLLFPIKGAKAFNAGVGDFTEVGVSAPDPQTLVVQLEKPMSWFVSMLMHPAYYPCHATSSRPRAAPTTAPAAGRSPVRWWATGPSASPSGVSTASSRWRRTPLLGRRQG